MIRDAAINDLDDLVIIGKKFFDETGYDDIIEYDNDSTYKTLESLITTDTGILVVSEEYGKIIGVAGGMIYPFYFNHNHTTGQEFFWWIEPKYRGSKIGIELFKALENSAKESGAKSFSMIALDSINPEAVGRIYDKSGYRKSEHTYIRSL